jgi:uncharacterized membrane protein (GlpM family)
MDIALLIVALLLLGAFVVIQVHSLVRWRRGWRIAAVLPLFGVAFVLARILLDTRRDPTSHNLWPFEIVVAAAAALVALGLMRGAMWIFAARGRPSTGVPHGGSR